jgi:ER membrane protein complex subunit 7
MHISNLLTLLGLPLALAIHVRVAISSSQQLLHPNTLPASTHATLTTLSNTYSAPLRSDNTFDFRNVSSGSYLLDVHCHTHAFAPLRVDVREVVTTVVGDDQEVQVWGTFRGNEWSNKGEVVQAQREEGVWTFDVRVQGGKDYFIERAGCESQPILFKSRFHLLMIWNSVSPLGLLKNPMILIAGFSMLIVFGMPYIMDNSSSLFHLKFHKLTGLQWTPT